MDQSRESKAIAVDDRQQLVDGAAAPLVLPGGEEEHHPEDRPDLGQLPLDVPTDVIQMLPFAAVMAVLVVFGRGASLPAALGSPYVRGGRDTDGERS